MLLRLKTKYGLVPLAPPDSDDFPGELEVLRRYSPNARVPKQTYEYTYWARNHGPIRYFNERSEPVDPVGRVARRLNIDADLSGGIDLESTPVVTWSRPCWFDDNQTWIVPSRLGTARSIFKDLPEDYRKMFRSIERNLKGSGELINSWDIPNSDEGVGLKFQRPHNVRNFMVIVWPEAAKLLSKGVRIYHWDA